ncbi:hypothetical protein M406DRAFT_36633 [Cryphonectria parasitica EP155]|uniref:Adenine deaminase n=1 Tax=Cryphonectria parasitica (strain ATCC 38755 / EP155) TaxID=660469 RepID=A0A9P4Y375_CRYP1|nr:uncharacterized protein M406DRAFT_36633 [Cryphonectria parasitica EP155]KAF3765796.1 hypothetical protein M406DRAFT_36633 [Cryphonectria parasitica EP155]
MCNQAMHGFLAALPKCEHHMHLEGSLSPELLFHLSEKNKIALPPTTEDPAFASVAALYERYARFTSLDDFLHYYYIGFTVLLHESDFEDLAYAYFTKAASHGVHHAEVFFDPQVHLARGIPYATIVGGFTAARRRAQANLGITSLLVPCLLRHLPVPDSLACFSTMRDAGHFADGTLAGMGLCSTERDNPPSLWREVYALAAADGVRLTAHAGEEGPAAYVTEALDVLKVTRIDHGVNARHDADVMRRLAGDRVMLSVCPLSNVVLRGVTKVSEVPIRVFLDNNVPFSINSDDPAYFGGYILDNYCAVQEAFGLSVDEWRTVARNAVKGSWCDEARKEVILGEIERVVGEWREKITA